VYVVHGPPWNTKLDRMSGNVPIGSKALRAFLEEHQPPLSLHGHIHESPERSGAIQDRIGRTLCVNPGASLHGLRGAVVELDALDEEVQRCPG